MAVEHVNGPGSIAMWDQGLAAAQEAIGKSCAFVLATVEKDTHYLRFVAVSNGLSPEGMVVLLDATLDRSLAMVSELEELV